MFNLLYHYRKTIFNAYVFANTGAGTIEQAVDMATNDFLNAGINCVQYSNGARVNIASYAEMAVRTANKRAYLQGEAVKREEWGIHTVYVTAHNTACPLCQDWQGLVYVDDEFGEGTASESKDLGYPLLSDAIAGGLFHPNCRNGMTTFFEGVNDEPVPPTDEDKAEQQENYEQAQQKSYNNRQILRYQRLREGSLDEDNKAKYKAKEKQWRERQSLLKKPSILSDNKYKLLPNDIMKDVRKAEQSISEDSIENLLIYDRKGNLLISKAGISSKVEVPKSSKKNIKGCIMTHNHPSGKTFSVEDVQTLFFSGVAELRATTKDGTFILRQPKTWHKGLSRPYKIRKEYEDILYSLQDKYIDIYNRDGLLLNQVEAMWTEETLKIFTKKFGLEYKFERW
ncbi:MAG: phage minor capsid protein [Clostridiales bacterium]